MRRHTIRSFTNKQVSLSMPVRHQVYAPACKEHITDAFKKFKRESDIDEVLKELGQIVGGNIAIGSTNFKHVGYDESITPDDMYYKVLFDYNIFEKNFSCDVKENLMDIPGARDIIASLHSNNFLDVLEGTSGKSVDLQYGWTDDDTDIAGFGEVLVNCHIESTSSGYSVVITGEVEVLLNLDFPDDQYQIWLDEVIKMA